MKSEKDDLSLIKITRKYATEEAARKFFEGLRWPDAPFCPHCGNADEKRIHPLTPNPEKKIRNGQYFCSDCRENFTVTVGTVMEDSHIPLNKWLIAFYMMCASKTQISALQLQRQLEIGSYRSALFMCHRIRYALKDHTPSDLLTGTVEADETYIGGKRKHVGGGYKKNKVPVVSLVERNGRVRSNILETVTGDEITKVLRRHVAKEATLNTDESPLYEKIGREFAGHDTVDHHIEDYAHIDESGRLVTTNTAEGFFGNSKRSLDGTHHHISRKHTDLYFAELDYKYNTRKFTDGERTEEAISKIEGKRLMLRQNGRK
jgi:transposase-like protein